MRQRYALDFGPRAREGKENVVVYRSRNIFYGESGTLLQRYDLAGVSVKGIDKRIINVYCTYEYAFTFAVER
jgi:hypothetical protein